MRALLCLGVLLAACGKPPDPGTTVSSPEPAVTSRGNPDEGIHIPWEPSTFSGKEDAAAQAWLESGSYQEAVRFGCTSMFRPFEASVERALREGTGEERLNALVLLLKARAPASIDLQWQVLQQIEGPAELLTELRSKFDEEKVLAGLRIKPPENRYTHDSLLEWYVRAAGVIRSRRALPTLIRLSREDHLGTSLAAERSLEDFPGEEGDQALADCLLGFQYDGFIRAGRALLKRNKPLLASKLKATIIPVRHRANAALLLAETDDPAAVPLLCESVTSVGIIDRRMFDHIERLAQPQDLPAVQELAARAREEQKERAALLLATLSAKFAGQ